MARQRAQTEYKGLSARAITLLARDENQGVDFKKSLSIVESEDFVQFANSPDGGALLIGVEEAQNQKGHQRGRVCGCEISDKSKMMILNKAESCVPRIPIRIFVENSSAKAFYRVEVPSGPHKPYCTSGGSYKIRLDGRKTPLLPIQLLQLFLETQTGQFLKHFAAATKTLEEDLNTISGQVALMEDEVEGRLYDILKTAGNAESLADDAESNSQQARDAIEAHASDHERVPEHVETLIHKLGLLLKHFDIEDPQETEAARVFADLFDRARTKRRPGGVPLSER